MLLKESGGYEARDPFVTYFEGRFYHCFTKNASSLWVSSAETPEGLRDAAPVCVYTPEEGREYSRELWAPELHVIDGVCYVYVACDDGRNENHRMYVLTNGTSDPAAPYRMVGKLTDESDKWAIDGTVFRYGGELYTVWSGWEGDKNVCQDLYIAKMDSPTSIASPRVRISTPEYEWEKMDCVGDGIGLPLINEGPCAYFHEGKLFLLYSASGSWANNYSIGVLRHKGGDLLDPRNWEKGSAPALSQAEGWNGPGHCSVTAVGERDYIAFHVYDEGKSEGWDNVHAVLAPFKLQKGKIVFETV